jgi:uncharacterized protein (TIGR03067 family)
MTCLRTLATCALTLLLIGADKDAPKTQDKDLDGSWEFVSGIRDGKPDQPPGKAVLIFKGNELAVKLGDKEMEKATIKADPTRTPRTLDIVPSMGPEKGNAALAIYEVKGDELRICVARPGKERPTEFSAKEGSGHSLITLKRVKS